LNDYGNNDNWKVEAVQYFCTGVPRVLPTCTYSDFWVANVAQVRLADLELRAAPKNRREGGGVRINTTLRNMMLNAGMATS
jgi:hypothetical protein